MILDEIKKLCVYGSLNPHFPKVVEYLHNTDINRLPEGRHDIDGDNAYILISQPALKNENDAAVEAHDRYIDIQVVLSGREKQGWINREQCRGVSATYNSEKDIIFYEDRPATVFDLSEGQMSIFFPWDGHAPLIGSGTVRKAVIKVAVGE